MEWVEVRSWVNADGSQLVMTTVRTSDMDLRTGSERAAIQQRQVDSGQAQSDQARPYAAVPVQGGWIVFQL